MIIVQNEMDDRVSLTRRDPTTRRLYSSSFDRAREKAFREKRNLRRPLRPMEEGFHVKLELRRNYVSHPVVPSAVHSSCYTSLYAVPYLERILCLRPHAREYFILFRSIRNEFQSTSHSTCSRPLCTIELHHFPDPV